MRQVTVGAAQLGPIAKDESRPEVVQRLLALMRAASRRGCDLVVFPELALTTFFPRWSIDDITDADHWYETEVPSPVTQPLFDEASRLGIGFCLGYAELSHDDAGTTTRRNIYLLVGKDGEPIAKFSKVHIPGHEKSEEWRPFQHLEKFYFDPGEEGFGVWEAFGGNIGMAICNDRRWPETYREMGLQGVEMILIGYNTPLYYAPDTTQNALAGFHNHLVMQSGAYQNGTFVVGVAKGGIEEGVDSLAHTVIIAPSGQIIAQAVTTGDELIVAACDLDFCNTYKHTLFDFDRYRMPEFYQRISNQRGAIPPGGSPS